MIAVRARRRFTVAGIAEEFGVSRRTMLRDLHALSEMGLPLAASPGPGGGYRLIAEARVPPLSLTVEEAIGMVVSYEAFMERTQTPFAESSVSAIIKLRHSMPSDVVERLDSVRSVVAILNSEREYRAPLLAELLAAALARRTLRIGYESRRERSERVIHPIGLYLADGFWYLACFDRDRGHELALRADRVFSLEPIEQQMEPTAMTLREFLDGYRRASVEMTRVRARVSRRAALGFDFQRLFGPIDVSKEGIGWLDMDVPMSEMGWYAEQILGLGDGVVVVEPVELAVAIRERAEAVVRAYRGAIRR